MAHSRQLFDILLTHGLDTEEIKFLQCLARYRKLELEEWKQKNNPDIKKGKILYTREINESFLERARLKNSVIVGRFSGNHSEFSESGFPALWDTARDGLEHLPLHTIPADKLRIVILSGNRLFNHSVRFMASSFSSVVTAYSSEEKFLGFLENHTGVSFVILDWDTPGLDTVRFTSRLESLKKEVRLPPFLSIKDFNRENLFMDLTGGIGKYSGTLYSHSEIYNLLLSSLSSGKGRQVEAPFFHIDYDSKGNALGVSLKKSSRPEENIELAAMRKFFNNF